MTFIPTPTYIETKRGVVLIGECRAKDRYYRQYIDLENDSVYFVDDERKPVYIIDFAGEVFNANNQTVGKFRINRDGETWSYYEGDKLVNEGSKRDLTMYEVDVIGELLRLP